MGTADSVNALVQKYRTRNPFILAEREGIEVLYKTYISTIGYYYPRYIVIEKNIHRVGQTVVCAHELGHAIMQPDILAFMDINHRMQYEYVATDFARFLLYPDDNRMTTKKMIEYIQFVVQKTRS